MSLSLTLNRELNQQPLLNKDGEVLLSSSKEEEEARNIMNEIFEHNEDRGALSTLSMGMPGSCKTAINCAFIDYAIDHYADDKIFWRSSIGAPLQFFKTKKWHIYVQKDSGIRLFDRHTGKDMTDGFTNDGKLTVFTDYDDLYNRSKTAVCNAVFFKDIHDKELPMDRGNIFWFGFFRYLLHKYAWCHIVFDEYHELIKAGSSGRLWKEIAQHSNDVSNARKSNVVLHGNCHQTSEVDYRVLANIMVTIQMYGSRAYSHNMVNKKALGNLPKPTEKSGAWAWISTGGRFGKFKVPKVYKNPVGFSVEAQVVDEFERTKVCKQCNHIFIYERNDQIFCSKMCGNAYHNPLHSKHKPLSLWKKKSNKSLSNAPTPMIS